MKYMFSMTTGHTTTMAILCNPVFDNGVVKATKIAKFTGFNVNGEYTFEKCTPCEFIAGGAGYTLEEYIG